jgi:subtilisin family serine protease
VTVAILDTGIDPNHPELSGKVVTGYSAVPGESSYKDLHGHGTHMAGIIAADTNGKGIVGAAPEVKLAAVRVLDRNAKGRASDLIDGLQWAQKKGIRLVNMSVSFSDENVPLERAIKRLNTKGMIMVAAAGNCQDDDDGGDEGDGDGAEEGPSACDPAQTAVMYPAAYPEVIAVAATDVDNRIARYSHSGPELTIAAPGGSRASKRILSTARGGGYCLGSGTSQATAHVTGGLALALQRDRKLTFQEARDLLQATAKDLGYPEAQQGAGLIDVEKMLRSLP